MPPELRAMRVIEPNEVHEKRGFRKKTNGASRELHTLRNQLKAAENELRLEKKRHEYSVNAKRDSEERLERRISELERSLDANMESMDAQAEVMDCLRHRNDSLEEEIRQVSGRPVMWQEIKPEEFCITNIDPVVFRVHDKISKKTELVRRENVNEVGPDKANSLNAVNLYRAMCRLLDTRPFDFQI